MSTNNMTSFARSRPPPTPPPPRLQDLELSPPQSGMPSLPSSPLMSSFVSSRASPHDTKMPAPSRPPAECSSLAEEESQEFKLEEEEDEEDYLDLMEEDDEEDYLDATEEDEEHEEEDSNVISSCPCSKNHSCHSSVNLAVSIFQRNNNLIQVSKAIKKLRCCCLQLPPSASCSLHQLPSSQMDWMFDRRVPPIGSKKAVILPDLTHGARKRRVQSYLRWRKKVWMPTRFYMEQQIKVLADDFIEICSDDDHDCSSTDDGEDYYDADGDGDDESY